MTDAQNEALRLLKLIDYVCIDMHILYSLCAAQLICYEFGYDDEHFDPNSIEICLRYDDYKRLVEHLDIHRKDYKIEVVNYFNLENFDSLSSWVMYSGNCLLPPERKADEWYYKTRLIITPLFYAGKSVNSCKKTCKYAEREVKYLDSRMPLPHMEIFTPAKENKLKRMQQRYYCRKKRNGMVSIEKLAVYLQNKNNDKDSKYLIYMNQDNSTAWMHTDEFCVERIDFYGVETNAIINRREFIERNYHDMVDTVSKRVSDLLLRGGRDLRRVQLIQLEMMKEIDRICRKHQLKYNIAFGTLLGAVRHGGFVPWDDDADINMPYEDYLKLVNMIDDEIDSEKYYFRYQDKEDDCNITYAHLKRNGTIYTKPGREGFKYHPGVYIDIVPLYNGAPNFLLHVVQTRICWFFRTACWAHMGAGNEKKLIKRTYYKLIGRIGNKRAYSLFLKWAAFFKHKSDKMLFLNGMDRSPYNIGFVKRECFENPIEIEFEGSMFYAPRDLKGVLEYCYGKDYMQYLPLARRKPKNDVLIDIGDLYADI